MTEPDPDFGTMTRTASDAVIDTTTRRRLGFGFWVSVGWLFLIIGVAVLAPWLPIADPNETCLLYTSAAADE